MLNHFLISSDSRQRAANNNDKKNKTKMKNLFDINIF